MTDSVLHDLLSEARHHAGGEPVQALRQCSGTFLQRVDADPTILQPAAESLQTLPPAGAGWVALVLGTAVERGADPAWAMPALVRCLRSWLPQLPEESEDEEDDPDPTPEQAELFKALQPFCQGLVAHLARMPAERQRLSEDTELLERLTTLSGFSHSHPLGWVLESLQRKSGPLIVLHPQTGAGLKLRYENIAHNFHLFSLLQVAVGTRLLGGQQPDPKIAAVARGQASDDIYDHAWWHYGDPRSKTPKIGASIWGEGLVTEIPIINDSRVILLWPPILGSRSWNDGFFGPHLEAMPANVVVEEELSSESAQEWLKTLGVA